MPETLKPQDFLKRLNEGKLETPLLFLGFAKPAEDNKETFLFSPGTSCKDWIPIPAGVVETVEHLGEQSCRDHSHPTIRIQFKEVPANQPLAAIFYSLLRSSLNAQARFKEGPDFDDGGGSFKDRLDAIWDAFERGVDAERGDAKGDRNERGRPGKAAEARDAAADARAEADAARDAADAAAAAARAAWAAAAAAEATESGRGGVACRRLKQKCAAGNQRACDEFEAKC